MFEEPQAKRIRRADAFEDAISESESDEEVTDTATIKDTQESMGLSYHFEYDLVENFNGKVTKFAHLQMDEPVPEETAPDDEAFEFRLFSIPKSSTKSGGDKISTTTSTAITKIKIRSPTPDEPSDGRFVKPYRPLSYYFAQDPPQDEFAIAAVSGTDILESSQSPWPGTRVPWRVIHLPEAKVSQLRSRTSDVSAALQSDGRARRKPSKKRRILLRTRAKAGDEQAKAREEHLREKKTRLNREKKIKRKAKEKAAKGAKGATAVDRQDAPGPCDAVRE